MAGFFPLFFKEYWSAGTDPNTSTALLGLANSLAGVAVAVSAPILGAMADQGGAKKRFLALFAYLGVLMTACLALVGRGDWVWAAACYTLGNLGFAGANSFYDALLPAVAGRRDLDFVSGLGYALGYLGGGLLFLVNVLMTLHPAAFGLADAAQAVRVSFVSVAAWWGGFAVLTLLWVPEPPGAERLSLAVMARRGWARLRATLGQVRSLPTVVWFLVAYWCYIDGVDTIIRMAVDYGLSLGFQAKDLIVALLLVQFVGFPAALGFGRLAQVWEVKKCLYLAIGVYLGVTLWAATMSRPWEFYAMAVVIGLVQGGAQALSRSFFARLIPPGRSAEFFGFYNLWGKFAALLGPLLMGLVGLGARWLLMPPAPTPEEVLLTQHAASRWSLAGIVVLLVVGLALLSRVDETRGRAEALAFDGEAEVRP
ncbi:MAG: MFS transporter [Deltaproteobacteria bacterium]|nr:MFS transporter [Deltaproteobacteria bacterium]